MCRSLFRSEQPAAVLLYGNSGIRNLAGVGLSSELRDQLEYLSQPGSADGMAFAFQAAGRVDRQASAQAGRAALRQCTAFASLAEAEVLGLQDFAHRRRVMHFCDMDVLRVDAGLLVRIGRRKSGDMRIDVPGGAQRCRAHDARSNYLTLWRMHVAEGRLREGRGSVAQIGQAVGYESEAAFSRAFKRQFGTAPGSWRRQTKS